MRNVCTITVAVVLLGLSPLLAANNAKLVGIPLPAAPNVAPNTVNEGFIATAVLAGMTDPQGIIPCFNCVTGPDIQTLLIALPLGAVFEGQSITIMVNGHDLFYGGNAAFTFSIKANPTVAPTMTGTVSCILPICSVSPGIWFAQFPITAPAKGHYILEGDIATGENLSQHTRVFSHLIIGAAN